MKKWMIPAFAVGGVAVVGTAVLGGILLFGNKPGMESPQEVALSELQARMIHGDFEEYISLGRYPMIEELWYDGEMTDMQAQQMLDTIEVYWTDNAETNVRALKMFDEVSIDSIEVIPVDASEAEEVISQYAKIGDSVEEVVDVTCNLYIKEGSDEGYDDTGVRAIKIDDRWYMDFIHTSLKTYMEDCYYEILENCQLND